MYLYVMVFCYASSPSDPGASYTVDLRSYEQVLSLFYMCVTGKVYLIL